MSESSETVLDSLYAARDNLRDAHANAGLGTQLMVSSVLDELTSLINRVENINARNSTNESTNGE